MLLITSGTLLKKVATHKKTDIQKMLIRFPFLAMLDFFSSFGDMNISECLTKKLILSL